MVAKKPGRYLAPVALIAVAIAVLMIVLGHGTPSHHAAAAAPPATHHTTSTTSTTHAAQKPNFYVIKSGDSLSGIAAKTGVSVATLESLNPSIDPAALQTGQRIRLRR
jgi:LysM repeat protein